MRQDAGLYGVPAAQIARRAAWLRRAHGFSLGEAHRLGLLDPAAPADAPGRYVSKRRLLAVQALLNPEELTHLTEEKTAFYRLAEGAGLPVPATHAVLCHSGAGATAAGRPLQGRRAWIDWLERESPEEFVVKPAKGYHGLNVRLVERRGRRLRLRGGEELTAAELCDLLLADRRFHVNLVQERVRNHPEMPGDPEVVSTVRVMALVGDAGGVEVLGCVMRIALGHADVDNIRGGATGNLLADLDAAAGTVGRVCGIDGRGRFAPAAHHDAPAPGTRLPCWDEALALARRASSAFLPMRAPAWALAPVGVDLVELPAHARAGMGRRHHAVGPRGDRGEQVVGPHLPARRRPGDGGRDAGRRGLGRRPRPLRLSGGRAVTSAASASSPRRSS